MFDLDSFLYITQGERSGYIIEGVGLILVCVFFGFLTWKTDRDFKGFTKLCLCFVAIMLLLLSIPYYDKYVHKEEINFAKHELIQPSNISDFEEISESNGWFILVDEESKNDSVNDKSLRENLDNSAAVPNWLTLYKSVDNEKKKYIVFTNPFKKDFQIAELPQDAKDFPVTKLLVSANGVVYLSITPAE